MSNYTDNLGIIGVGDGKVVLPSPPITSGQNPFVRGPNDGEFCWGLVTGVEPDPSLGFQFVEPAAYQLEVTPDLGWTNKEDLFQPYLDPTFGNPQLRIFKNLREGNELVVSPDETACYTLSAELMNTILAPGFEDYLWRVRAVAPSGHEGHSSEIQYFRGKVWVSSLAWTVDDLPEFSNRMTVLLTGRRSAAVTRVEVNGKEIWTSFLSPETWQAEVPLAGGRNVFFIRVYDAQGNGSEYRQLEIKAESKTLRSEEYWNRFDDFGYTMGLERLPGERNKPYKTRIKDVYKHRGGSDYRGLMNAITRELNLPYYDQALLVNVAENPETGKPWTDVVVWLTARNFCVQRDSFLSRDEYQVVEGRTWQVRPSFLMDEFMDVFSHLGKKIPREHYKFEWDVDGSYLQFLDPRYAGQPIYLTYRYYQCVSTAGKTVQELADELEALTVNGKAILSITTSTDAATKRAEGLEMFPPITVGYREYIDRGQELAADLPVRWSQAELRSFMDPDFIETQRNSRGTLWGTAYEGWAYQLKNEMKTTWGFLLADKSVWTDEKIRVSGIGRVPHHYDSPKGNWITTRGDTEFQLDAACAALRGYLDPRDRSALRWLGVPWQWFESGYAWGYALFTLVDSTPFNITSTAEEFVTVRQTVQAGHGASFDDLGLDTVGS